MQTPSGVLDVCEYKCSSSVRLINNKLFKQLVLSSGLAREKEEAIFSKQRI